MRSSSPINSSPSSHQPSSSRVAKRTYSKRVTVHVQKRKAQAALPSSDTEESGEDDEIQLGRKNFAGESKKMRRGLDRGSPSPRRIAGWNLEVEGHEEEEEQEMVEETSPTRRTERRSKLSNSECSSILASPTRSASPPKPLWKRSGDTLQESRTRETNGQRSRSMSGSYGIYGAGSRAVPVVNLEPPSSSPTLNIRTRNPSTPPRKSHRAAGPLMPHSSPRDLSALFAAVSPARHPALSQQLRSGGEGSKGGSVSQPGKAVRTGGLRRMLTKTQSLGAVPDSPSKPGATSKFSAEDSLSDKSTPLSGLSTPSRSIGPTRSLPESPLRSSHLTATPRLVLDSALAVPSGSGGKAKRTYGGSRTFLAESSGPAAGVSVARSDDTEVLGRNDILAKQSYAELRKRYGVDNTEAADDGSESGILIGVGLQSPTEQEHQGLTNQQDQLPAGAPQPISDMRSRGENRRFMDEIGYLADGIADSAASISLKRAR